MINLKHVSKHFSITRPVIVLLSLLFACSAFAADDLAGLFSESTVKGELRYRSTNLDISDSTDASDSVIGGLMTVHTGELHGISFGVTFARANNFFSDDSDYTYGMLKDDSNGRHQSFTAMKESYVQGNWFNTIIKYGGQDIDTPWVGPTNYSYFVPITYKGLTISNTSLDNIELKAYYITGISDHAETGFKDIIKSRNNVITGASLADENDKPLIIGGVKYKLPSDSIRFEAEGWGYHMDDVVNIESAKATLGKQYGEWYLGLTPSYGKLVSTGDELAGNFSTYQGALMMDVNAYGFDLVMAYAQNGNASFIWSGGSAVQAQFLMGDRAKEKTKYGWLYYDFSKIGLNGLNAGITYADYDTPDSGAHASSDVTEVDYNVMYDFNDSVLKGALNGLHVEVRYGVMNYDTDPDMKELQFLTTYAFAFGGKSQPKN